MKIGRIGRVVKLLTTLQSGKKYGIKELMEVLEVSRRTVFRDLGELEKIGVPFYYDAGTKSYEIDPAYYLQPVDLKLQEALSLLMLVHKTVKFIPIPFQQSAVMAGLKIENNLPVSVREYCGMSLENVSFKKAQCEWCDNLDELFGKLQRAVKDKRVVRLKYKSVYGNEGVIKTDLKPMHLMYNRRAWYVLGFSSLHKEVRTFKLGRIIELELLGRRFVEDKKFDVSEHYGRAWSMIPEGRLWNVRLRFDSMVATNVSEVRWHETQKVQWNIDGSCDMEFRVDGLNEISWWILGYGDKVEVIKPVELRKRVLKVAENMVEKNQMSENRKQRAESSEQNFNDK